MSGDPGDHGDSWAGRRLGPYLIEEQIGRGGMGVVYRAEQTTLGRKVALKLIAPQLAQEPAFRDRFRRESRLAAAIDHPNIIPVYEAEIAGDDLLYIAMRYVEGTDLRAIIQREGHLDVRRAAGIVAQVASALDAAHARDLVHRDVKPANVLIAGTPPQEHAYLTDFGLTKHIASDSALTETGQWVGTLDFVAPEQIMGEAVDGRADIYSLGCVFYEALTGHPPFPRDADVAKIYAHLNEPAPRVTDQFPELSSEFDDVIATALAKRREDRYPTAGEMRQAVLGLVSPRQHRRPTPASSLDRAQGPSGSGAWEGAGVSPYTPAVSSRQHTRPEPVVPRAAAPPPPPYPPRRRGWIGAVAVGLLALGAAAGIAAASGVFSSDSGSTSRQAANGPASGPGTTTTKPKHKTTTPRVPTTPPTVASPPGPGAGGFKHFQTGITAGRSVAATYCDVSSSLLYCWTPDDGYTIEIPSDGRAQRLRSDKGVNEGRTPGGYSTVAINDTNARNGFTCTSRVTGLSCRSQAGYGFDLPRDVKLPTCVAPQEVAVPCE
jgi:serine/threonine-protein kinase